MTLIWPIFRDLLIGFSVQFFAMLFAASTLDNGQVLFATSRLSAAYWCGVIFVLVRRSNQPTRGDVLYIRWGLIPILIVGVPLAFALWTRRGIL